MAGSRSRTSASTDAATDGVPRVEIVMRGERRREYTAEQWAQILTETALQGARVLVVAQRHGISPSLIHRWRREAEGRPVQHKTARRPPRLVPLIVGPSAAVAVPEPVGAAIEVVLRNGRVLRVGGEADVVAVARLAAALEG